MAFKIPRLFAAATKAKAAEVNENFAAIENEINDVLAPGLFETGDLKPTARANPAAGWLLCDGAAVSRSTYSALFAAIGTAFGVGDGATTFNVPDMRGRVPVGVDGAAGRLTTNDELGKSGGAEKHTLSTAEMPSHLHGVNLGTSTESVFHTHSFGWFQNTRSQGNIGSYQNIEAGGNSVSNVNNVAHIHSVVGNTGSTGSGGAHNNMQPFQVCNWLVKV